MLQIATIVFLAVALATGDVSPWVWIALGTECAAIVIETVVTQTTTTLSRTSRRRRL